MRLEELTRVAVAETAADSVLVLAFGAIEQHGPHLPFGTDFLVVDTVARRAVERAGEEAALVLAPTLPFGSSHHHLEVGGALSLSAPVFEAGARDLLSAAAASGFRRVFVVNGHGGNERGLEAAAAAAPGSLVVGGGSYWTLARAALEPVLPDGMLFPGHAGRFETSLALALGADTAAAPRREDWDAVAERARWFTESRSWRAIDGYTDDPSAGSAEDGAVLLDTIVAAVAAAILDFDRATR